MSTDTVSSFILHVYVSPRAAAQNGKARGRGGRRRKKEGIGEKSKEMENYDWKKVRK